jgi:hypothetical protein
MTTEIPAIEFYNLLGISHHNVNHQFPRSGLSHLEEQSPQLPWKTACSEK